MELPGENKRIVREMEHHRRICSRAEEIWGWQTPAGRLRVKRRSALFAALGGFDSTKRLLELGCGTGVFTREVQGTTEAQITAIDISDELLERARSKHSGNGILYVRENAMSMSFPSESFDAVFASSSLHHMDLDNALREIYRVLRPGGRVVFSEPNMLNPHVFALMHFSMLKKGAGVSEDETAFTRWAVKRALRAAGFINIQIFPYDFLHPRTPAFLVRALSRLSPFMEKIPLLREIAGSLFIAADKTPENL